MLINILLDIFRVVRVILNKLKSKWLFNIKIIIMIKVSNIFFVVIWCEIFWLLLVIKVIKVGKLEMGFIMVKKVMKVKINFEIIWLFYLIIKC